MHTEKQDDDNRHGHHAPEQNCNGIFLLIDSAQYHAVWRVLEYRYRRLPWISLCEEAEDVESSPVLIHVPADQTRTLAWFLEHTQGMHCLSWIISPLNLIDLREHLRGLTRIAVEDGSEYDMRFYDTRILPAWYQMLDQQQEPHALGPITSWTYLAYDGMPCTIFGHNQKTAPAAQTLRLTSTQEQKLLDAALPDIVLQRLEENGNADLEAMPATQRHDFIAEQVTKARQQYGITSSEEIVLFCSLALGIGRNFDKLLPVAQVLQRFSGNFTPQAMQARPA